MSSLRPSTPAAWVYLSLAILGLALTAVFNIRGVLEPSGNLLAAWFANPATSSLSIDLLVTASAASIFIILEGRRLGIRWPWLFVIASFIPPGTASGGGAAAVKNSTTCGRGRFSAAGALSSVDITIGAPQRCVTL